MARNKTPIETTGWDSDGTPEYQIEKSRSRVKNEQRPHKNLVHEGTFHIRDEWKSFFPGYQLAFIRERLLNQEDTINVEKAFRDGYRSVKIEECPWLQIHEESEVNLDKSDGIYRLCGLRLMKKPMEDFLDKQLDYQEEAEFVRQQAGELTNYLGGTHQEPRFRVENTHGYSPMSINRRT